MSSAPAANAATSAPSAASSATSGRENGENNQNKPNSAAPPSSKGPGSSSGAGAGHPEAHSYVGPYRLEKTLGKGQTGRTIFNTCVPEEEGCTHILAMLSNSRGIPSMKSFYVDPA